MYALITITKEMKKKQKNKCNTTRQVAKSSKSHIPFLVSSVHLHENNTIMVVMIVAR